MNPQQARRHQGNTSRRPSARNVTRAKQQMKNAKLNNNHGENNQEDDDDDDEEPTMASGVQRPNGSRDDRSISPDRAKEGQRLNRNEADPSSTFESIEDESFSLSEPPGFTTLVKQDSSPIVIRPSNRLNSMQNSHENNWKHNGSNICTFSSQNPLPPRFQQQLERREAAAAANRFRRTRTVYSSNRATDQGIPNYAPSVRTPRYHRTNGHPSDHFVRQQESSANPDYSSGSEVLSDVPSMSGNNSGSPLLSTSAESQWSQGVADPAGTSTGLLDELISVFDRVSFSSDDLELILNKIAAKHLVNRQEFQRLLSSTKTEKSIERILDETYRSQVKILAVELQSERNRVLELTQTNADMEKLIRQLQQQSQSFVHYQQAIVQHRMQLARLMDENARLKHQLQACPAMVNALNELKQQHDILNEELDKLRVRNSALENEAADSERASKHAAEVYKKADAQKQERIEQMMADVNKYKKADKELTALRQKHRELEQAHEAKVNELTLERDQLQVQCDQLNLKMHEHEQSADPSADDLRQQLNGFRAKNDQLRQRNWKIMEELNRLLREQEQQQSGQPS